GRRPGPRPAARRTWTCRSPRARRRRRAAPGRRTGRGGGCGRRERARPAPGVWGRGQDASTVGRGRTRPHDGARGRRPRGRVLAPDAPSEVETHIARRGTAPGAGRTGAAASIV